MRASNTEPLLRMAVEARTQQQVDELYGRVFDLLSNTSEQDKNQNH